MGWGEATPEQSTCTKSNWGRTNDAPPPCSICFFILNSQCSDYREGFWVEEKQRTFPGNTSWGSSSRVSALWGILCGFHMGSGFCGFDRLTRSGGGDALHTGSGLWRWRAVWPGTSYRTSLCPFSTNSSSQMILILVWLQSGVFLQPYLVPKINAMMVTL